MVRPIQNQETVVIMSKAKNLILFNGAKIEILRFAQDDNYLSDRQENEVL